MESLRPRLVLIVGLALAPLVLASIGRGALHLDAGEKETQQKLSDTALYAAGREQALFADAKRFMERLESRPQLRAGPGACDRLLENSLIGAPLFVNATLIGADGNAKCNAAPDSVTPNYSGLPWWPTMKARRDFTVGSRHYSPLVKREIVPVALPIYRSDGTFDGALSVSIDIDVLSRQIAGDRLPSMAMMLVLDRSGNVVTSSQPVSQNLQRAVAQFARNNLQRTFATAAGGKWRWAAEPIDGVGALVAIGIPASSMMGTAPMEFFADVLFPLLMILFAWVAIWLGTEWLVLRWITYLKRVSVAFGRGRLAGGAVELAAAPAEFRVLGNEIAKMASSIQARDLKLNQALRQEAVLAREIHHRVKNNLQIVSSLINLYAREITDPVARLAFRQIVARVDALSLVHRLIEKKGAVPVIAMKPLILELADQIRVLAEADVRPYLLELEIDDCDLSVDVMTPVALFVVEALLSGLFGSGPPVQLVRLSLRVEEHEHLLLSVENPALVDAVLQGDTPSSARILNALCEQLKGRMWLDASPTHRLMLRIGLQTHTGQSRMLSDDILGWGEDALPASVYDGQRISKWDHPASH